MTWSKSGGNTLGTFKLFIDKIDDHKKFLSHYNRKVCELSVLWIKHLSQRLGEWPPKETTCFSLSTRAVSRPSHKLMITTAVTVWSICIWCPLYPCLCDQIINKINTKRSKTWSKKEPAWTNILIRWGQRRIWAQNPCYTEFRGQSWS